MIQVPEEHGPGSLAWITFPDQDSKTIFLDNAGLAQARSSQIAENGSGLYHSFWPIEEHTLLFFESQDTLSDAGKFSKFLDQR